MAERAVLSDAEAIVPRSEHGLEPLCACWRTSALGDIQSALERGTRKVTEAMKLLRLEILDETHWKGFDSDRRLFWNMNTPEDYEEARRIFQTEKQ
jgi:molybdopterin-guanine dinucleotide biosynthesis protein A